MSRARALFEGLCEYWYAAALSEEVGTKRPVGRTVLGEMIVLWRTRDGKAKAMADRCLHRNALLSEGDLFDDCIGCPYHGWTYDADGRCVNVPSEGRDGRPQLDRVLETYPVREEAGLVWVWMGEGDPTRRRPFPMPRYDDAGYQSYYMRTRFSNNVTNLAENFMDVPHTVFVHRGWFRSRSKKRVRATVERTEHSVLVTYDQPKDSIGFTSWLANPRGLPLVHTDKFYLPNTTRVDYVFGEQERAFIITSTCTPISELETMVYTLITYKLGLSTRLLSRFLPWYTRRVIQQDVEIMEIQGRGLRHYGGATRFSSTPADTLHLYIEDLMAWAREGHETPLPPIRQEMEFWI